MNKKVQIMIFSSRTALPFPAFFAGEDEDQEGVQEVVDDDVNGGWDGG